MTVVASALAGGDCIDDADVLRTCGTAGAIGCVVEAPSTGDLSAHFRWKTIVRPARTTVSRENMATPGQAGAQSGDGPLTNEPEGGHPSGRRLRSGQGRSAPPQLTGQRGYHPLMAVPPTGKIADVPAARAGQHFCSGIAHFHARDALAGALRRPRGHRPLKCGRQGFEPTPLDAACNFSPSAVRWMSASGITVRQHCLAQSHRGHSAGRTGRPSATALDGAADVAELAYTPFQIEPDAGRVRRIVRSGAAHGFPRRRNCATYAITAACPTREGETLESGADLRRHDRGRDPCHPRPYV